MSKELEPHPRRVIRLLSTSRFGQRVQIWSPISLQEAIKDIVDLDSSNFRRIWPDQTDYLLPNQRDYLVDNLYSDQIPDGFSNGRFTGFEEASFVLYKGVLGTPQNGRPEGMRFAIMQTKLPRDSIMLIVNEARVRRRNALRPRMPSEYFAEDDGYSGNTRLS